MLFFEFIFRCLSFIKRRLPWTKEKEFEKREVELILDPKNFKPCSYVLPESYNLRLFKERDFYQFHMLMLRVNMGFCPLKFWKNYILPGGFWVVEETRTGRIVGAEFAAIDPRNPKDSVGTLEWLASDPRHRGLRIGPILASKTASRLIDEGFKKIRVGTHLHRKVVIRMYEKQGWKLTN